MLHILLQNIFPSELLSKMGCSKHCSEEQRNFIKKLTVEGKTYKVQQIIGCSAKMISNALKWQQNPKRGEENEQLLLKWIEELPVSAVIVRRRS